MIVERKARFGQSLLCIVLAAAWAQDGWFVARAQNAAQEISQDERDLKEARKVNDRVAEAKALHSIAYTYKSIGKPEKALESLRQVLFIEREIGNHKGEGDTLTAIGEVYNDLGQPQKALELSNQALSIQREVGDRGGEANTLTSIGEIYNTAGQPQKALEFYNQAIATERETGNRSDEAATLDAMGAAYQDIGQPQKALESYNQAVLLERNLGDRNKEAITLHGIGAVYQDLGQPRKALEFYDEALSIEQQVGNRGAEATTLSNMGGAYRDIGQLHKAMEAFNQVLPIQREVGDRRHEAITLHDIGAVYQEVGHAQKARVFYNQALSMERQVGDQGTEAFTSWRLASLEGTGSLQTYLGALQLAKAVGDLNLQGLVNTSLMRHFHQQKQPATAIFFGKEAVNDFQQIRGNIRGLDMELQDSFVQSKADTYRMLAKLLIDEGRIPEAERVISMLKEQEYFEFTRGDNGSEDPGKPAVLTDSEQEAEAITATELTWIGLTVNSPGNKQTDALEKKLSDENERFREKLQRILATEVERKAVLSSVLTMQNILNEVQQRSPDTVGVYTLVLEKELDLIVVTKHLTVSPRIVAISRDNLNTKVGEFRKQLQDPCSDPRKTAFDLYRLLIFPILKDLEGAGAKTIVWELDGALRYIPVGALYDGHQYVAETYKNVLFTTTHSDALVSTVDVKNWQALGMGVSQSRGGLSDLAAVPEELEGIIHDPVGDSKSHGPLPGKILLDDNFTSETMKKEINAGFPIVHIASHFILEPGSDQMSYLLLGSGGAGQSDGGRVTVAQLRGVGYRFDNVQLLTLSACETGTSGGPREEDGKEIDGLGELVESKGAKSVLATLWDVSDASTGQFMIDFYGLWTTGAGSLKVEALRHAQENMLRHGRPDTTRRACKASLASPSLTHPFYWAPYILIGNWQ